MTQMTNQVVIKVVDAHLVEAYGFVDPDTANEVAMTLLNFAGSYNVTFGQVNRAIYQTYANAPLAYKTAREIYTDVIPA